MTCFKGNEIVLGQDLQEPAFVLLRKNELGSFVDVRLEPVPKGVADDLGKALLPDEADDPGFVIKIRFEDDVHAFHGFLLLIHIYIITHLHQYVNTITVS